MKKVILSTFSFSISAVLLLGVFTSGFLVVKNVVNDVGVDYIPSIFHDISITSKQYSILSKKAQFDGDGISLGDVCVEMKNGEIQEIKSQNGYYHGDYIKFSKGVWVKGKNDLSINAEETSMNQKSILMKKCIVQNNKMKISADNAEILQNNQQVTFYKNVKTICVDDFLQKISIKCQKMMVNNFENIKIIGDCSIKTPNFLIATKNIDIKVNKNGKIVNMNSKNDTKIIGRDFEIYGNSMKYEKNLFEVIGNVRIIKKGKISMYSDNISINTITGRISMKEINGKIEL